MKQKKQAIPLDTQRKFSRAARKINKISKSVYFVMMIVIFQGYGL
ncbi:hypothetical protein [Methanosarcina mazei]|nr:hypothetical protein [Methanosarcina mazei]